MECIADCDTFVGQAVGYAMECCHQSLQRLCRDSGLGKSRSAMHRKPNNPFQPLREKESLEND